MKFEKGGLHKLVEIRGALVILADPNDKLKGQRAQPLIVGTMPWICAYMEAYSAARESGLDLCKAHDIALKSNRIPKLGRSELNEKTFIENLNG